MSRSPAPSAVTPFGIPDHHVGVGTGGERALPRPQPEGLRRRHAAQPHPVRGGDPPVVHGLPEEGEPGLDPREPAGDLGEVAHAPRFPARPGAAVGARERAVVRADGLDPPVGQSRPQALRRAAPAAAAGCRRSPRRRGPRAWSRRGTGTAGRSRPGSGRPAPGRRRSRPGPRRRRRARRRSRRRSVRRARRRGSSPRPRGAGAGCERAR